MGHVNNAAYLDYLEEALLAAGDRRRAGARPVVPRRIRLEYVAAGRAGRRARRVRLGDRRRRGRDGLGVAARPTTSGASWPGAS